MRTGVWLSGVAAAFGFIVGIAAAAGGDSWLLVPGIASLITAIAWSESRTILWGVMAVIAHWAPLVLVAVTAWRWVGLGTPLLPGAVAQSVALYVYSRAQRTATVSAV